MRNLRLALWIVVAVVLFGLGALTIANPALFGLGFLFATNTSARPGAPLGGPFTLVDDKGVPVTEAIFRGKPSVTLFGYTHCPDVCPTGLTEMARWGGELGGDADKLRFVFVTVDPERDTQAAMHDYVNAFSDRIVGITGAPIAVHAMTKDYKIYSLKVPTSGGDYSMDHTASMILQDSRGNFVGTIDSGEAHDVGLAKLRRLVAG